MAQRQRSAGLPDGTVLTYVEQGADDGVPVLFLHAVGESWRSWARLLPHLRAGTRALAVDQRGHGDSDKPLLGYRLDQASADVVDLLDAIGVERAVLAGTSSGGLVAQHVAVRHPDRVLALLLAGSPRGLRGLPAPDWVRDSAALTDPVPAAFVRESIESFTPGRVLPTAFVEMMVEDGVRVPAAVWRSSVQGLLDADPPTDGGTITAPTVALWGDRDTVLPQQGQERMVAAIPDARLVIFPGTGHLLLWEEPEAVATELERLVAAVR